MQPLRILLVEDHYLARLALHSVIDARSDMRIAGETGDGKQALALYRQLRPDLTIMDVRLPGIGGIEAIRAIRDFDSRARVVVLTNYDQSEDVYRAIQAGALAYLLKDTSGDELVRAILTVSEGQRYLPSAVANRLAERLSANELTPREVQVLELIAHGMSNRQIADRLSIAEKTVRIHVSSVLDKMGLADRTQAAIAAIQRGIVHLDRG